MCWEHMFLLDEIFKGVRWYRTPPHEGDVRFRDRITWLVTLLTLVSVQHTT